MSWTYLGGDQRALVCASELCDRLEKSSPPPAVSTALPPLFATRRRTIDSSRTAPHGAYPWERKPRISSQCVCAPIDYRIVHSSFPDPVAELECVTLPWRLLQEAWPRDGGLLCGSASLHILWLAWWRCLHRSVESTEGVSQNVVPG